MPKIVNHDERKEMILEISIDLFLENGFKETSLGDIAEKCELSRTSLYQYFSNKNAILNTSIEKRIESLRDQLNTFSSENKLNKEKALKKGILMILSDIVESQELCRIYFSHYYNTFDNNSKVCIDLASSYLINFFESLLESTGQKKDTINPSIVILTDYLTHFILKTIIFSKDKVSLVTINDDIDKLDSILVLL